MGSEAAIAVRFSALAPHLNERQKRLWVGAEARALGRGGISAVARATRVSRPTIYKALSELDQPPIGGRVRRAGGGRKKLSQTDPELAAALDALLDPDSRGDPMSCSDWSEIRRRAARAGVRARSGARSPMCSASACRRAVRSGPGSTTPRAL